MVDPNHESSQIISHSMEVYVAYLILPRRRFSLLGVEGDLHDAIKALIEVVLQCYKCTGCFSHFAPLTWLSSRGSVMPRRKSGRRAAL